MKRRKKGDPTKPKKAAVAAPPDATTAAELLDLFDPKAEEDTEERECFEQTEMTTFLMKGDPDLFGEEENRRIARRHAQLWQRECGGTATPEEIAERAQLVNRIYTAISQLADRRAAERPLGQKNRWWHT